MVLGKGDGSLLIGFNMGGISNLKNAIGSSENYK